MEQDKNRNENEILDEELQDVSGGIPRPRPRQPKPNPTTDRREPREFPSASVRDL